MKLAAFFMVLGLALVVLANEWPKDMRAATHRVGGELGTEFSFIADVEHVMTKIKVWRKHYDVVGIKVFFSDGREALFGSQHDEMREYEFDRKKAEHITKLWLWPNPWGNLLGRIKFETSAKGTFDVGQSSDKQDSRDINVASGIPIGVVGRSTRRIDEFAFVFLPKMRRIYYDNIKLSDFDREANLELQTLDEAYFTYHGKYYEPDFHSDKTFVTQHSFTHSHSSVAGGQVSYEVQLPLVATVGSTVKWETSRTQTVAESMSESKTIGFSLANKVASKEDQTHCVAQLRVGTLSLSWEGTLNLVVDLGFGKPGRHFKIPGQGTLDRVDCSVTSAYCRARVVTGLEDGPAARLKRFATLPREGEV
ncbi:hypothetical protein Micbo1qcDRAFT_225563 [Microdochium bolleyi]|uniref:Jacalin-type lectin domain-containing protein n=1 Tax=Microdochium bolleyi TaxID=196109 RepID=A0A136IJK2_9PEZI|nr:hypothetical protein Micbo1qcDRAFT_225563 [Microdochium bolleyi]